MSGTQNPLAAPMPAPTNAAGNAAIPQAVPSQQGPPPVSAMVGQFRASGMGPAEFPKAMGRLNFLSDTVAKLAAKPNVTRKDVVKATADAVGSRHVTADEAIGFLNKLPDDGDQLHQFLQQAHQNLLAGSVALHAYGHEMLGQMQPQQPGAAPAPPVAVPAAGPNPLAMPATGGTP